MEENYPIKRIIDDRGHFVDSTFEKEIDEKLVKELYYHMLRVRTFDRKAINLQRQGHLSTYATFEAQEAAQVGSALALQPDDWVFPTYRDHGATITFGKSMTRTFLYWNGRVEGCVAPPDRHIFPPAVPIATQLPHAAGAAWAEKLKGTENCSSA
mgnify:FL=1